jgi:anti-sigma factor RsiW
LSNAIEEMNFPDQAHNNGCPSIDIAAYIDCELSADAELDLEKHLAGCFECTAELNRQKQFLSALNLSLADGPDIPADFTKQVVTNAESTVGGLRRRSEWLNALFVCCGLLFFVLFTLGASAGKAFTPFFDLIGSFFAVAGFAAHLVYDISIAAVIVLRSVASQPEFGQVATFSLVGVFFGLAALLSRSARSTSIKDHRPQGENRV